LRQFAARLAAVHEALAAVVTPDMQTAIDAEVAQFEVSMQKYNKRMRRQPRRTAQAGLWGAVTEEPDRRGACPDRVDSNSSIEQRKPPGRRSTNSGAS
jgi:hypothetical protein